MPSSPRRFPAPWSAEVQPNYYVVRGAMAIVDVDPGVGAAVAAVIASSDGVCNVKTQRLFSMDEVLGIRKKRIQLQKSYSPPGE